MNLIHIPGQWACREWVQARVPVKVATRVGGKYLDEQLRIQKAQHSKVESLKFWCALESSGRPVKKQIAGFNT